LFIFILSTCTAIDFPTPLQTYVQTPDPTYSYTLTSTIKGPTTTSYFLNLISQTWLTAQDVRPSIWKHWLEIVVPDQYSGSLQSAVIVGGGGNSDSPPVGQDITAVILATTTNSVVCHLSQIPNQPTFFASEGFNRRRSEDAIIAFTWDHFLRDPTHNPLWLLRLPMVKAVVRAMDAAQDFLPRRGVPSPEKFIILGGSKRGWTTWLLPAVDTRVNAIVPMVIPILNLVNSVNQMWRSWGMWTYTFYDYMEMGTLDFLNRPEFQLMADIIDPLVYMPYLEPIPKYMIFATGDEFFLPDNPRNFYNDVRGQFNLRMAPNTDHSLSALSEVIINAISTFFLYIINDVPIPTLKETIVYSNTTSSITVIPSSPPTEAKLWQATTVSDTRRDFRLHMCPGANCNQPVIWTSNTLTPNPDGSYSASVSAPTTGWTGFMIELSYQTNFNQGQNWFQITSEVVVVPDRYPFPSCGQDCGNNGTQILQNLHSVRY
jgi:PhoPQ-activated pathogenicity-related protein